MKTVAVIGYALTSGTLAALLAGCGGSQPPFGVPNAMQRDLAPQWRAQRLARTACPQVVGKPTCLALQVTDHDGITPLCSPSSSCGFTPAELQTAYDLTSRLGGGSGTKVAVIEAGDLSAASSDLATYRSQYGLGTASFFKYNENGQQSNYPPSCENYGWCLEIDLDIDMISASCPNCTIYLMEAKDGSTISDFEQAEKEAVTLGATIVSNSWTCYGSWDCGDSNFGSYFNTSGIAYLASSGDAGYDSIGGPSVLDTVLAVGGTQLSKNGSGYGETIWNDGGFGCATPDIVGSPGVPKPSWQHDPDCAYRTEVDVSAESGCSPGVAMYISMYGGWIDVCGTSVASPFLAGVVGLAGNAANLNGGKYAWTLTKKQHKKYFNHPTGSAGSCGNYMCGDGRYMKYYSAPGGWGSPNGVRGF
ncbi:MAG TPA: S8 family serine peptidase [Candidatus Cybelea sp.]|jgi:subtilase family serine protease